MLDDGEEVKESGPPKTVVNIEDEPAADIGQSKDILTGSTTNKEPEEA